jgi:uncharacterized membrane protein YvbJ
MADTSQRRRFLQCPRCGAENLPTSKFCAQCGMNLRGEVQAPAATTLAPKAGAVMPYSPGQRGPGRTAQLAAIFLAFVLLACLFLGYLFFSSGADRTPPRPTATPPRTGMVPPAPPFWGEIVTAR